MRRKAIDTALGKIASSLSLVEWKTYKNNKFQRDELYYYLNIQPNLNQNATDFWNKVVRKLFIENEVLIIVTSEDYFLVADEYETSPYVLKENVYKNIKVDDLEFKRNFTDGEVIRLNFRNTELKKMLSSLDDSYGKLFNRLVQVSLRTNQIRGTAKLSGTLSKDKNAQDYLQTFVDKIFTAFENKSVAVVPVQDGMDYTELSREQNTRSQIDELNKVYDEYLNSVLEVLGIHPSLVKGDMADISKHQDNYLINVIQPLVEQITDEINRKFYSMSEVHSGSRLKASVVKLRYVSIFDIGTQAEKLVGSTITNPNEVRDEAGLDELDMEELNHFYMTKNNENITLKGGDENKQETS